MKKNLSFVMAVGWVFSLSLAGLAEAQDNMQIATWAGFRSAAASFTFDDNAPSHVTKVAPEFKKRGYAATFNVVTSWMNQQNAWSNFAGLVADGHEIASHTDSHGSGDLSNELASSKSTINQKITGQDCNTIAYPYCTVPTNGSALKSNYMGGRICDGQVMGKSPSDYFRISAITTGSGDGNNFNDVTQLTGKMQQAKNQGGWVVFLTHGIQGESNGSATYSPTSLSTITGALDWAKTNDIWVTTFRDAIMYSKERDKSTIAKKSGDASSETYTLTHSIKDNVSNYDYPLSIRVKNSNNWTTVSGTQGGKAITTSIKDGYIYFDAVPNGGDIVISSGGSTPPASSASTQPQPGSSASTITSTASITIEMEDYMQGGQGVGYSDIDGKSDNTGYRPDDAGVVAVETGYAIGYTMAGEWFNYSVETACEGQYSVVARVATGNANTTRFSVSVDNVAGSVAVDVPSTGSWDTYTEVNGTGTLKLSKGKNVVKVNIDESYVNVDWIKLTSDNAQCPEVIPVAKNLRLNSLSGPVQYQVFDMNGHLLKSGTVSAQGSVQNLWSTASRGLSKGTYVLRYGNGASIGSVQVRK
ncbi:carbohydrate-binding protein [Fibrobacter sp.]|uniref:carbohydrate-binding protein n=1 Tax=Fibrobacter sp. TaxID=35828 RepID=UPI00388D2C3B